MMMLLMRLKDIVGNATYGNAALKTLIETADTVADNIYARLGAPAGASMSADIAAIYAKVDTEIALLATAADLATLARRWTTSTSKVYPTLAAAVTVAGAAGAQTLGAFVQIVAAAAITTDCYVDTVYITAVSAPQLGELVLYHGAGQTEFARIIVDATGAYKLSVFKTIPANDKIEAKYASTAGGAQTVDVKLGYHLIS